ncbi:MAG: alpha-galactosidase [Bacteroidales bacterium]|nr:alpha-galactosidase [Bacteroidales bacterium]
MNYKRIVQLIVLPALLIVALTGCNRQVKIESGDLLIEFNKKLYSRVNSINPSVEEFNKLFQLSEFLETKDFKTNGFKMVNTSYESVTDSLGCGQKTILKGSFSQHGICIDKVVEVMVYDTIKNFAFFNIYYINCGRQNLRVKKWANHAYHVKSDNNDSVFWSFQGSSTVERKDWVRPVGRGYYDKNFMGMNQSDYGGGIPVTDIWRRDAGLSLGHTELVPREVNLPVYYSNYSDYVYVALEKEFNRLLEFNIGDTLKTYGSFVSVHTGDFYRTLRNYSQVMQKKGIEAPAAEPSAFEPVWCGWGYGRKFTKIEIIQTLPKVKELGIKWAVIDDGYQIAEGDWRVNTRQFPGGGNDMKQLTAAIHNHGLKAKLWWAPLAADPGSQILKDDPLVLLINESGSPQYISWWNSWYMSPAYSGTIAHTLEMVKTFIGDWGFDGLKLDGQHMNAVPEEHNYKRPLPYPSQSIEALPGFFKSVFTAAREFKPDAVVENCPCGCCMSFYNMPYANQFVASDPKSTWQVRHRGKTYKALMPQTAFFGDHAELSESAEKYFASVYGIGAVPGTKFTWPADNPFSLEKNLLTPDKEKLWKKWFSLYNSKMPSKGVYLGELYDIGFDVPEGHVIQSGDTLRYAFYANSWSGEIPLRGLGELSYRVTNAVDGKSLGVVNGSNPSIKVGFEKYLLLEVFPE